MTTMRRLARMVATVAVGTAAVLGCGRFIDDSVGEGAPGGDPDASSNDVASADVLPPGIDAQSRADGTLLDGPPVPSCRPAVVDDFEAPDWKDNHPQWGTFFSGDAVIDTEGPGHAGGKGLVIKTASADDIAYITREPTNTCVITVDFWFMHAGAATQRIVLLDLVSNGRARFLALKEASLQLEVEGQRLFQVSSDLAGGVYHHVVLRHDPTSGEMTVAVDGNGSVKVDPTDAPPAPSVTLRIGILGISGIAMASGARLMFDDVEIR
jgi:hypothetical protein